MNDILKQIRNIKPDNDFIRYIVKRVQKDDYRGWRSSQHNRYDISDVEIILKNIYKISINKLIKIPLGDNKKGTILSSEYDIFSTIVDLISSEMKSKKDDRKKKGTIDSLRKNFFVDFHRMGFIHRYNSKKEKTNPWSRNAVHYINLSEMGINFVKNKNNLMEKYYIFTRGIDNLFENRIEQLLNTIYYSDFKSDWISIYELMFIFTDKSEKTDKIKLLRSYRSLEKNQRMKLINLIKKYANPKKFRGTKVIKKDFSNWKNKAQQILYLLKNTVYFEANEKGFKLNVGKLGVISETPMRTQTAKDDYFKKHKINKIKNFELHHIIPFRSARNKHEFKLIDNYKNLIYLSRSKHKKIRKNQDKNVILYITDLKVQFQDFEKNNIFAINNKDTKYSKNKVRVMDKHNTDLLHSIFEFKKNI